MGRDECWWGEGGRGERESVDGEGEGESVDGKGGTRWRMKGAARNGDWRREQLGMGIGEERLRKRGKDKIEGWRMGGVECSVIWKESVSAQV